MVALEDKTRDENKVLNESLSAAVRRKGSFFQTVSAVAWSFFGVRKGSGYEEDIAKVNPVHVIVAGVIGALLFIFGLIFLIQWILSSGVATS